MQTKVIVAAAIAALGWMGASRAQAALYNIQFQGGDVGSAVAPVYSGPAVVGSSGDVWNGIPNTENAAVGLPLEDNTGSTSAGVTITNALNGQYSSTSENNLGQYANLLEGYAYAANNNASSFTLTGLPAGTYDVYAYSDPASDGQGRTTQVTANGVSAVVGPNNNTAPFALGANYIELTPTVTAAGTLTVSWTGSFNGAVGEGDINAVQVQSVSTPEPASLSLAGIGVAGLLLRRKRRSA